MDEGEISEGVRETICDNSMCAHGFAKVVRVPRRNATFKPWSSIANIEEVGVTIGTEKAPVQLRGEYPRLCGACYAAVDRAKKTSAPSATPPAPIEETPRVAPTRATRVTQQTKSTRGLFPESPHPGSSPLPPPESPLRPRQHATQLKIPSEGASHMAFVGNVDKLLRVLSGTPCKFTARGGIPCPGKQVVNVGAAEHGPSVQFYTHCSDCHRTWHFNAAEQLPPRIADGPAVDGVQPTVPTPIPQREDLVLVIANILAGIGHAKYSSITRTVFESAVSAEKFKIVEGFVLRAADRLMDINLRDTWKAIGEEGVVVCCDCGWHERSKANRKGQSDAGTVVVISLATREVVSYHMCHKRDDGAMAYEGSSQGMECHGMRLALELATKHGVKIRALIKDGDAKAAEVAAQFKISLLRCYIHCFRRLYGALTTLPSVPCTCPSVAKANGSAGARKDHVLITDDLASQVVSHIQRTFKTVCHHYGNGRGDKWIKQSVKTDFLAAVQLYLLHLKGVHSYTYEVADRGSVRKVTIVCGYHGDEWRGRSGGAVTCAEQHAVISKIVTEHIEKNVDKLFEDGYSSLLHAPSYVLILITVFLPRSLSLISQTRTESAHARPTLARRTSVCVTQSSPKELMFAPTYIGSDTYLPSSHRTSAGVMSAKRAIG